MISALEQCKHSREGPSDKNGLKNLDHDDDAKWHWKRDVTLGRSTLVAC